MQSIRLNTTLKETISLLRTLVPVYPVMLVLIFHPRFTFLFWRWSRQILPKRLQFSVRLHDVTFQYSSVFLVVCFLLFNNAALSTRWVSSGVIMSRWGVRIGGGRGESWVWFPIVEEGLKKRPKTSNWIAGFGRNSWKLWCKRQKCLWNSSRML
jgi:hypothetical protein